MEHRLRPAVRHRRVMENEPVKKGGLLMIEEEVAVVDDASRTAAQRAVLENLRRGLDLVDGVRAEMRERSRQVIVMATAITGLVPTQESNLNTCWAITALVFYAILVSIGAYLIAPKDGWLTSVKLSTISDKVQGRSLDESDEEATLYVLTSGYDSALSENSQKLRFMAWLQWALLVVFVLCTCSWVMAVLQTTATAAK